MTSGQYNQKPVIAVWEITMGCNMRCMHCVSSCENALPDELTTEEALRLCDDLKELGIKMVAISGGEPITRKDWHTIAARLASNGIKTTMISNGWVFDDEIAKKAKKVGINSISFSLDGLKATHDKIRRPGSFDRVINAINIAHNNGMLCSVMTTVHSINIEDLEGMYEVLSKMDISAWQLQSLFPTGNALENKEVARIEPIHIDQIIDFGYSHLGKSKMEIQFNDCIGYFNSKEIAVRAEMLLNKINPEIDYNWFGCSGGKSIIDIMHNGDIMPCMAFRDKSFVVGNVRQEKITKIWNKSIKFDFLRNMTKNKLDGLCSKCIHGDRCLGGCPVVRLTTEGSIYSENRYCSYSLEMKCEMANLDKTISPNARIKTARTHINAKSYQTAGYLLEQHIKDSGYNYDAYVLYGFASLMMNNIEDARRIYQDLIYRLPEDVFANRGYGMTLARMGDIDKGIEYLRKATKLSKPPEMDAYHDLAQILYENNKFTEALSILEKGFKLYPPLRTTTSELYKRLT